MNRFSLIVSFALLPGIVAAAEFDSCKVRDLVENGRGINPAAWVINRVIRAKNDDCYYDTNRQALPKSLLEIRKAYDSGPGSKAKLLAIREAINLVIESLQKENKSIFFRQAMLTELKNWQVQIGSMDSGSIPQYLTPVNDFTLKVSGLRFGDTYDIDQQLRQLCSIELWRTDSHLCLNAIDSAGRSLQHIYAMNLVNEMAGSDDFKAVLAGITTLDKRWNAYFEVAKPQNIIETLVNSALSPKPTSDEGFAPVPNSQLILLHPSIAMEYVHDASEGNQFEEALVLELVGINRWRWGNDGATERPLGISVIAAYSDREGATDLGWGIMGHINHKYSFGVTKHGGDNGFFISLDLQEYFTSWSSSKKASFPGFKDLSNILTSEKAKEIE